MKKIMGLLIVLVAVFTLPMVAQAAGKLHVEEVGECVDNNDDTCERKFKFSYEGDEKTFSSLQVNIHYKPKNGKQNGIVNVKFDAADGMSVLPSPADNGYTANFVPSSGSITSSKFDLGTMTLTVQKGDEYDCSFTYDFDGQTYEVTVTTETVVETGAGLPLAIIACGLVVALGVYFVARRQTKIYKI